MTTLVEAEIFFANTQVCSYAETINICVLTSRLVALPAQSLSAHIPTRPETLVLLNINSAILPTVYLKLSHSESHAVIQDTFIDRSAFVYFYSNHVLIKTT